MFQGKTTLKLYQNWHVLPEYFWFQLAYLLFGDPQVYFATRWGHPPCRGLHKYMSCSRLVTCGYSDCTPRMLKNRCCCEQSRDFTPPIETSKCILSAHWNMLAENTGRLASWFIAGGTSLVCWNSSCPMLLCRWSGLVVCLVSTAATNKSDLLHAVIWTAGGDSSICRND